MKVRYRVGKDTDFKFNEGDMVKVIEVSFLYADEKRPEKVYTGEITEIDDDNGFWIKSESLEDEEFVAFQEIEEVIGINDEYPNRKDPLVRFALDGP